MATSFFSSQRGEGGRERGGALKIPLVPWGMIEGVKEGCGQRHSKSVLQDPPSSLTLKTAGRESKRKSSSSASKKDGQAIHGQNKTLTFNRAN